MFWKRFENSKRVLRPLFVYPVVLGRAQRLFPDSTQVPKLRLEESRQFRSGIVLLRYRTV